MYSILSLALPPYGVWWSTLILMVMLPIGPGVGTWQLEFFDFGYKETDLFLSSSGNEGMSGSFGAHLGRERERGAMSGGSSDGRWGSWMLWLAGLEIQTIAVFVPMRSLAALKKMCECMCVCIWWLPGLSCGSWDLQPPLWHKTYLVAVCKILELHRLWKLVPWPGIEPGSLWIESMESGLWTSKNVSHPQSMFLINKYSWLLKLSETVFFMLATNSGTAMNFLVSSSLCLSLFSKSPKI